MHHDLSTSKKSIHANCALYFQAFWSHSITFCEEQTEVFIANVHLMYIYLAWSVAPDLNGIVCCFSHDIMEK